jgi:nicotinamidase/pyrazinamidase
MAEGLKPSDSDVFLVVDVQNDFCPGGALAVPEGEAVVPVINDLAKGFKNVVMTQDWHPPGHSSFASSHPGKQPFETTTLDYGEQTLWPDHCVQGSTGAAFRADLDLPNCRMIIRKGDRREVDSYSAFYENDHRTTRTTTGRRPDWPAIYGLTGCGGCSWPAWPRISVCSTRRSTPARRASRRS